MTARTRRSQRLSFALVAASALLGACTMRSSPQLDAYFGAQLFAESFQRTDVSFPWLFVETSEASHDYIVYELSDAESAAFFVVDWRLRQSGSMGDGAQRPLPPADYSPALPIAVVPPDRFDSWLAEWIARSRPGTTWDGALDFALLTSPGVTPPSFEAPGCRPALFGRMEPSRQAD